MFVAELSQRKSEKTYNRDMIKYLSVYFTC